MARVWRQSLKEVGEQWNLKFRVAHIPLELREPRKEFFAGSEEEMGNGDGGTISGCIEERVADIARANLSIQQPGNVEQVLTIGANQAEIDGWRRLHFDFQQLISNIRKLAVVRIR